MAPPGAPPTRCARRNCARAMARPGRASWFAPTNSPDFPANSSTAFPRVPKEPQMNSTTHLPRFAARLFLATAALACTSAFAAGGPDEALAAWLGNEFTVTTSSQRDHVPVGGKLTLVYDQEDDVIRVCARSVPAK